MVAKRRLNARRDYRSLNRDTEARSISEPEPDVIRSYGFIN
jgi:hypothetical protein